MPNLKKIDSLLGAIDRDIVDIRAVLSRVETGKLEMGESLPIAQKANLLTAIKAKDAAIEMAWVAIKQEWPNP